MTRTESETPAAANADSHRGKSAHATRQQLDDTLAAFAEIGRLARLSGVDIDVSVDRDGGRLSRTRINGATSAHERLRIDQEVRTLVAAVHLPQRLQRIRLDYYHEHGLRCGYEMFSRHGLRQFWRNGRGLKEQRSPGDELEGQMKLATCLRRAVDFDLHAGQIGRAHV